MDTQDSLQDLIAHTDLRYIAVEGVIGAGKTTLCTMLGETLGAQIVKEQFEENPFLKDFYRDPERYAFQTQIFFLLTRYKQQRSLSQADLFHRFLVTDYIFEKDKIFANLNLSDPELEVYDRYYKLFRSQLPGPDLVIYLQASTDVLRKRLRKKNAAGERAINMEYMAEVNKAYEHFFFHYSASDLLVVNTSEIDFVEHSQDLQNLLQRVSEPIRGTQYFLPLGGAEGAGA